MEVQMSYWKRKLAGPLPVIQWSHAGYSRKSAPVETELLSLPESFVRKLQESSRAEGTTPFLTLLAAYKLLLHRYSRQDDILVGMTVAIQETQKIETVSGTAGNPVALRTQVNSALTFRELAARVRETSLEAFSHADLPFEKLMEELHPGQTGDHHPIFQAWFSVTGSMSDFPLGDATVKIVHIPEAEFDLSLSVVERGEEMDCFFAYNTHAFEAKVINRMVTDFARLLRAVIDAPGSELSQLDTGVKPHVTAPQKPTHDSMETLDILIAEQAHRTPGAPAVTCGRQSLTYGELNTRANRLAHLLQKRGVAPEVMVGICVERSVDMLVGILAILKAGGAYVPLDPNYPTDRLQHMINETNSPVLITQQKLLGNLPPTDAAIITLDSDWPTIAREPDSTCQSGVKGENLAYVIFTSGSTGKPKGVLISHSNLLHSTKARFVCYPEHLKSYLLISSFAFDSSVAGIFWTLCAGGHLVMPEDGLHQDPDELIRLITGNNVSHFLSLPSLYDLILQRSEGDAQKLASLSVSIVAGESCSQALVERHARLLPETTLYNEYGPTEGTVWCTLAKLAAGQKVTIGKPIPTAHIYLLDQNEKPVTEGEPGELYVGGCGIARGYLNRPDLTAEKFVRDPFSEEPGRLYRTGDLARFSPDGNIEFLGRVDHQVKIRGYRIELEEIEAVLRQHPAVRDAVVIARPDENAGSAAEKRLIAYVVSNSEVSARKAELRAFVEETLPEYMVPATIVFLSQFPQTPNGKVDRNALPSPSETDNDSAEAFTAPSTPFECKVAEIWTEVLGLKQVGRGDDFFQIGGHSLLAIQVIARIRDVFQVQLALRTLFDFSTLESFSVAIVEAMLNDEASAESIAALAEIEALSNDEAQKLLATQAHSESVHH